ncbi:MAG: hypothetical protein M3Z24_10765 [Chloroflexota bacterium]|nr:hypothetical protein [Chloroflexota bacterium]
MQQAYRLLRIVSEAQTIRILLTSSPGVSMLDELCTACTTLTGGNSADIKVVVLDFQPTSNANNGEALLTEENVSQACRAVQAVEQPVLAVVREGTLSEAASRLVDAADLRLIAQTAIFTRGKETETGSAALRFGYATWSTSTRNIDSEMERILDMLRDKSAVALRLTKESVRIGVRCHAEGIVPLEALKQVDDLHLTEVMGTEDASEGLRAFLEKRKPTWKNR